MNEELEPLGLPTSAPDEKSRTLSELVAQHPLVAVAASAAVGAGVMALIAIGSRQRDTPAHGLGAEASEKVSAIQSQLSELFARLTDSLPSKADVSQAAGHLGDKATKAYNGALNGAKHSLHEVSAAGANVTHTAAAHPLLTSLILGALGTVLATMAASSSTSEAKKSPEPVAPNGSGPVDEASI
jgi:ElaB/YqjD/DUF883 family membrane-anchored ribosome-binding protein